MKNYKNIFIMSSAILLTGTIAGTAWAFQEAPMLAEKVRAGELPPVEERLPENPTVVNALEVGQYGGTWSRAFKGPGDRWGPTKLMEERVIKWSQEPGGELKLVPGYIESYSVSEDSREFTFTLLKGLKWSDGHPVTTEDVEFWYNDVFMNRDLLASVDQTLAPGGKPMKLEVIDEQTFKVSFEDPYVYFLEILAKDSTGEPSLDRPSFIFPKHYLKQFNNKYASEAELKAAAEKFGVEKWQDLWGSKGAATAWWQNPELPVITAWKIEQPAPADVVTMVRNPYYYAVDQAGNQLPYIDRISHRLFSEQEAFNLMIVQGQIDMQMRYVEPQDFTFYKENEAKGEYQVNRWTQAQTWSLVPNLNTKDDVLRSLYETPDFRQALSIAIDREIVNDLVFSGLAEARQASPVTGSPNFDPDLETHWAEYDPDRANELLDGIGLTERDGDGYRLRPDGKRLSIVVEMQHANGPKTMEIIADNFKSIGVELLPRLIDRTQWDASRDNNEFQMQWFPFDRLSVVAADPRIMMGSDSYANQYYIWYSTKGASGIEPPADHPIREVFAKWDVAAKAATREEADAALTELINTFVTEGWVIGVVGEMPALSIVKNNVKNFREGLIEDDITRGVGLAKTQQMWIQQ
ncbi:ABC transporter substrate-binding protein [Peteryoungia desertarenae]|uniref:ABC transporter substrate-binding protein n=1 Tax=Peteryoungia desertarenae TaxID=1813451 RepID=A0ABX6QIR2_9HYPH|nr:ABC transporter substrate-binding protein [Peteryoungia desertarenae]QLF68456.1 ABC transporter substrate-binding protein [Peteryoungia desertarenae]